MACACDGVGPCNRHQSAADSKAETVARLVFGVLGVLMVFLAIMAWLTLAGGGL